MERENWFFFFLLLLFIIDFLVYTQRNHKEFYRSSLTVEPGWKGIDENEERRRRSVGVVCCVCGGFCPWVDGVFFRVALEAAMEEDEQVSEPLQGLSFPAGPSLTRYFGSFQKRERERLLIWIGDDISHPTLEHRGRAGGRDRAALAWPCVASVWCNVLVGSQCASAFLSLSPLPLYLSLSLSWWRGCLFPSGEQRAPHSNDSLLLLPPSPQFLFSCVRRCLQASSSPLYHGQGRDQDRKRAELSFSSCIYPQKLFLCLATIHLFFYFFSPQLLSKHTHKKERKKEQSNADWCPCVCTFRDFRVRGGHLKPFPSRKKKKTTNIK